MKNKRDNPDFPTVPKRVFGWFFTYYTEEPLLGDLEEEFLMISREKSASHGRFWVWMQLIKSIPFLTKNLIYWSITMFKNYLKIAVRNILKHKGFSFINLAGLAIGMACTILILVWVQDELSYDRFHKNAGDIYRVIQDIHLNEDVTWAITQGPLGPALKEDFPEIVNYTRITDRYFRLKYGDNCFDEIVGFADPTLFDMFDFPLLKGDQNEALTTPHSIVISEAAALKYFGSEDPLGKVLKADDKYDFTVTGVLKKVPRNSHLQFDFFIPFVFGRELEYSVDQWNNTQFTTYVMLRKNAQVDKVARKIARYLDSKPTLEEGTILKLQPLTRIHLYSNYEFDGFGRGDIKYVYIFSITAFFVLLIACINFMNLATARSARRAREVGMRKVVGASRRALVRQFFGESILFSLISLIFAISIVQLLLPVFNNLAGKDLKLDLSGNIVILLEILGVALVTGIISGSYPALMLSSFKPVKILKGESKARKSGAIFRKILVVTQFSLSLILIIGTFVIYKQIDYMKSKKLGYDREHLVYIWMRGDFMKKYEAVKNELLQNPNILNVTRTSRLPTFGTVFSNSKWDWEGRNPGEEVLMHGNFVDFDYFDTFGMEIVKGRSFSKEFTTDKYTVVLNEEAVKRMGVESPVGMVLKNGEDKTSIVGVVKNFHFRSLHKKIEPLVLIQAPQFCRILCTRIKPRTVSTVIKFLEKKYKKFAPDYPFDYGFLDERLDRLYRQEMRVGTIFKYFTLLTIFISCLGLFGLASFMTEQRTKEIGIRKVLGATISGLILLLSKEFARWVLAANLIAWPVAYLAMNKWLQNFAFRTSINVEIFIFSGLLALLIAIFTVSIQTIKAAHTNPVKALKYE